MPKEDIDELAAGIRQAMARGEKIEKAMMSFYNSGYKKQDIEQAAAIAIQPEMGMQLQPTQTTQQTQQPVEQQTKQPIQQKQPQKPQQTQQAQEQQPQQQVQQTQPQQTQYSQQQIYQPKPLPAQNQVVQRVSNYNTGRTKPSKTGMAITMLLFILLLLLIGILVAVVLFKDELTNFFNNLPWRALF